MSNKMRKYFLLLILLAAASSISTYELQQGDFSRLYNYGLYRSWLGKSNIGSQVPSSFTPAGITQLFTQASGREIRVYYPWQDHEVTNLIEKVDGYLQSSLDLDRTKRSFLGALLYRLNAVDSIFVYELAEANDVEIIYGPSGSQNSLEHLWNNYRHQRFECFYIRASSREYDDRLALDLLSRQDSLTVLIPRDLRDFDFPVDTEIGFVFPEPAVIPKTKPAKPLKPATSLTEHILLNHEVVINRELLHNKIDNFTAFLGTELREHSLSVSGNNYILRKSSSHEGISADLSLDKFDNEDGIEVYPGRNYVIEDRVLKVGERDMVEMKGLEQQDINRIAPFIAPLLYEHRALGSKLINFLLIHDSVPTTLIVHGEQREKYEFDSYAELLLLLSSFWQQRVIYFGLKDFRKVNNYIEFKGILIAEDTDRQKQDIAEVWFHLSREYRIDLVMMILHPEDREEG